MSKRTLENERKIIEQAKADPDRFAPLYEAYFYQVFTFCHRRVGDQELASDLCSQTFLKALINLRSYQFTGAPFVAWLLRIASNEINQYFRKSKRVTEVSLNEQHLQRLSEEVSVRNTEQNRVRLIKVLNELPLEESQLIELRFFEQYSFASIASLYNITEANAKMKVYRILKRMKQSIITEDAS